MTDKKRTLSAQMPVNAVLAALAANALSEGTVRWAFPALLAVFCFLIWKVRIWSSSQPRVIGPDKPLLPDRIALMIIAAAFGVLTIIGRQYNHSGSWGALFSSRAALSDTFFRMCGMAVLAYYAAWSLIMLYRTNPGREGSGKNRFFFWWMVFVIVWLPYLIANYPGHLMGDTCSQIPMAFNMPNKFSNMVTRLSEDVLMTSHHPVIHTMALGAAIRLGRAFFGGDTPGLFLYTLTQFLIMTGIYGYAISWLERRKLPRLLVYVPALVWLLVPNFVEYAILATKDGIFSSLLLLYSIRVADLLLCREEQIRTRDLVVLMITAILCMLMRNNGFYIIVLSLPFLAGALRKTRKKILLLTALVLVLHAGYGKALLPALKISSTGVREFLSIPLQQTARYLVNYPEEVTQEERETLEKVLNVESAIEAYTPKKADPVKARFRVKATGDDLAGFFKVWLSILRRHPGSCIQATLCSLNGYYSFQEKSYWSYKIDSALKQAERLRQESGFDIQYPQRFDKTRRWMAWKMKQSLDNPFIYILMQAAFYNWILVIILWIAFTRRQWKVLALFMPAAVALLTALAGPMNASSYFRYEYPVAVVLPALLPVLIHFGRSSLRMERW